MTLCGATLCRTRCATEDLRARAVATGCGRRLAFALPLPRFDLFFDLLFDFARLDLVAVDLAALDLPRLDRTAFLRCRLRRRPMAVRPTLSRNSFSNG